MKKSFTLLAFLLCLNNLKAQFVTIPDANFVAWLQTNVPSAMNGNQMDTTSLAVTSKTHSILNNLAITDLTGIQYFDSLRVLDFGNRPQGTTYNNLTNLPNLPSRLDTLICESNNLTILPTLPFSIKYLNCYNNSLTNLPNLPNTLKYLSCGGNNLTNLPLLPTSLTFLECAYNNISTLPILPSTLLELICNDNASITLLPTLPNELKTLLCHSCSLSFLAALPDSLSYLSVNGNPISILPTLPQKLNTLYCNTTNISSVPILPSTLKELSLDGNINLTSLPSLPYDLKELSCQSCSLTSLPVLPDSLRALWCRNNQITSVPDLSKNMEILAIGGNPISCLPILPNSLQYLDIRVTLISCIPNHPQNIIFEGVPSFTIPPLCIYGDSITNPNGCSIGDGIKGYTYIDNDLNCQKNSGDITLNNIKIKLFDSNGNYLNQSSSHSGMYNFVQSLGTYQVILDTVNVPYKGYCHTSKIDTIVQLTSINQDINDVNFSLKCKPGFDLGVQSILTNGIVFPGQNHHLKIAAGDMSQWYNLNCVAGISGQVVINVSGPVRFIAPANGALIPIVSGTTFTYNIADFGSVNFTNDFDIILKTDTTASTGDSICVSVNITPISGDGNINNNTYHLCYGVVNSYDPNMKEVYPINVEPNYEDWLTYTIHFQNTGNAPAFNIRLVDTLDSNLNLETFKVINYSHNNTWAINNKVVFFNFQNIQLPDSTSDSEASKGYIQYKIKPKSNLGVGTKIKNTAYIYFDYNSPIRTNTTINEYTQAVSIKENFKALLSTIYPNPTNGCFTIELNSKEKLLIQLFDITGNIVLSQTIENGKATIDASYLSAGIYNISIKGNSGIINKKMVIAK
jgi:uncharacterized repeat protein (TIGR01451 family)